jgi:hypothetical protein
VSETEAHHERRSRPAGTDRVTARADHDRDCCGRGLGGERGGPAARRDDHAHPAAHEIGGQLGKSAVLAFRPAEFQRHVLTILITPSEAFANCGYLLDPLGGRAGIEEAHHRHRWLLRACRERPRGRRATERG